MREETTDETAGQEPDRGARCAKQPERCPYCGTTLRLVWVHGHGQCAGCGINIRPCCDGGA